MRPAFSQIGMHVANVLLFLVGTLPMFVIAITGLRGRLADSSVAENVLWGLVFLVGGLVTATLNVRVFIEARRTRAMNDPVCLKCGYDLRGAEHEACPECGTPKVETRRATEQHGEGTEGS